MSDWSGKSIGRYHLIEKLGEGGMAVVYRAFDTNLNCDVAIKFIRMEKLTLEGSEKARARFKIEAQKTASLAHPNIVPVTDYGEEEGVPYLVMRYIPGGVTLKNLMAGQMPFMDAVRLLLPIADALQTAHASGVVHRDVKPLNILIAPSGIPMLSDFGIAKVLEVDEKIDNLTTAGMAIGTPAYMAPEQWEGKKIDGRADIYSLGVVLYEMITGRTPFQADTVPAMMVQALRDPLPRPSTFAPGLPEAVEQVLFKALARDPQYRFSTMTEFSAALQKILLLPGPQGGGFYPSQPQTDSLATQAIDPAYSTFQTNVGYTGAPPAYIPPLPETKKDHSSKVIVGVVLAGIAVFVVLAVIYSNFLGPSTGQPMAAATAPVQQSSSGNSSSSGSSAGNTSSAGSSAATVAPQQMSTPGLHSVSGCGSDSHLKVGDLAYVSPDSGSNGIRSTADTVPSDNIIARASEGSVLLITDDAVCDVGGYLLWQVKPTYKTDWEEGWTPEVADAFNDYWLNPVPSWKPCGSSLISHLKKGDRATVTTVYDSGARIRAGAGQSYDRLGSIPPGQGMDILDGPVCSEGYIWWNVRSDGNLSGWTVEGGDGEFWIVPVINK